MVWRLSPRYMSDSPHPMAQYTDGLRASLIITIQKQLPSHHWRHKRTATSTVAQGAQALQTTHRRQAGSVSYNASELVYVRPAS